MSRTRRTDHGSAAVNRPLELEPLEPRVLLSGNVTAHWIGGSGNWSDASKWDIGVVPNNGGGNTYDVVIDLAGSDPAITIDQSVTVNSLTDSEAVTVTGGQSLTVKNGMVLNGTLTLASGQYPYESRVYFMGTQSLTGSGEVVFGGTWYDRLYVQGSDSQGTLTIGPGITIHGSQSGSIEGYYGNESLVNEGTIVADAAGKTITVSVGNLTNQGTMGAIAGTLSVGGSLSSWSNEGTLGVSDGGTLNLGGTFTLAALGTFGRTGGTVNITGTLDNTGTTLALDATTGSWNLASNGTTKGGTITTVGGAQLVAAGGTLDGVVLDTDMTVGGGQSLSVANGMVLDGTLTLEGGPYPYGNCVYLWGTQTLSGTGEVVFGGTGTSYIYVAGGWGDQVTLTIGAGITIHGSQDGRIERYYYCNASLVNQGTIVADTAGKTITVSVGKLTNQGTISGASVFVTDLTNSGNIEVAAAGTIDVDGILRIDGMGKLGGYSGAWIRVGGSSLGNTQNQDQGAGQVGVRFDGSGTFASPQSLEVMASDAGPALPGTGHVYVYG